MLYGASRPRHSVSVSTLCLGIKLPEHHNLDWRLFKLEGHITISILPLLVKLMEGVVYDQVIRHFSVKKFNSDFQHTYKEGHSTTTALMEKVNPWLSDTDSNKMAGAVLLDFSAAFDSVDHEKLFKTCCVLF